MAKHGTTDIHSDAPPSALRDPSALAAGLAIDPDDSHDLIGRTVTINRPRQELYAFWRDFRNLPLFMENIESVTIRRAALALGGAGAGGSTVEWDSVITEDIPGELIDWPSDDGADIPNSGRIEFRDSQQRARHVVTATIAYDPPAGARQAVRQALPARAEDPGAPGAAPLQAAHGNRRDLDL